MNVVEASCIIEKVSGTEYRLRPRTNLDKSLLSGFVGGKGRFVNVRLVNRVQPKSYDMTKAFWALASLHYAAFNGGRTPNSKQSHSWYEDLLKPELFPVRPNIVKEDKFEPKGWSELTKEEGIEVISKMVSLVSEAEGLPDSIGIQVRDLFEWIQQEKNGLYKDPCDYNEDGAPLTKEEWCERNKICMLTGLMGGDVCHIVSRELGKGYEWLIEQPWNFYRGAHELHIQVQHLRGWEQLFNCDPPYAMSNGKNFLGAPWLRPRYERAMRIFNEGKRLVNAGYSKEQILKHLAYSDSPEHDAPVETERYDTRSLARMAAEQVSTQEDIF